MVGIGFEDDGDDDDVDDAMMVEGGGGVPSFRKAAVEEDDSHTAPPLHGTRTPVGVARTLDGISRLPPSEGLPLYEPEVQDGMILTEDMAQEQHLILSCMREVLLLHDYYY